QRLPAGAPDEVAHLDVVPVEMEVQPVEPRRRVHEPEGLADRTFRLEVRVAPDGSPALRVVLLVVGRDARDAGEAVVTAVLDGRAEVAEYACAARFREHREAVRQPLVEL